MKENSYTSLASPATFDCRSVKSLSNIVIPSHIPVLLNQAIVDEQ